jgi:SAM-dependent methyltransferase
MQSESEWAARGDALASSLAQLLLRYAPANAQRGLDIGCQRGGLMDTLARSTGLQWWGIDPILIEQEQTLQETTIGPGRADAIPYPDGYFDCAVFANVFEHVTPDTRQASLDEMFRVMRSGGVIAGQIPNPYFPIESHSRLPFMGFLPIRLQKKYWKLSRVPWEHDFFVVTPRTLRRHAKAAGFTVLAVNTFNYPPAAIPRRVRSVAKVLTPAMSLYPWAWQFVLYRPSIAS